MFVCGIPKHENNYTGQSETKRAKPMNQLISGWLIADVIFGSMLRLSWQIGMEEQDRQYKVYKVKL